MKRVLSFLLVLGLCLGLAGCSSGDTKSPDNDTKNKSNEEKKDNSDEKKKNTKKEEAKVYGIGETVTYSEDDQALINFVVNSVKVTDERNQFEESNPAQVVVINYTYENIADENDVYISSINFKVIDEGGNVCETYPAGANVYPQATPAGAKSTGEEAYGLIQQSSKIKLIVEFKFLSDKKATFELPIQ